MATAVPFSLSLNKLETVDYVIFFTVCIGSCTGGLWYSATASKRNNVKDVTDYLLGGKTMLTFPVALSLIASYVSGVTILGTPAEVYNYGSQYWLVVVGVACSCICVAVVYLPVFCTLRLSSSYEYLQLRFNKNVRAIASFLFLLDEIFFLPMVVYIPALAFNQLTGYNEYAVGATMVIVCGLYTVLGGLRAVVWTDSVQTAVMYVGVLTITIAGTIGVGGAAVVINTAKASGRLSLSNWDFSPFERQTGWGSVIGGFLYWTCFNSVNQTMVQRYLALPTKAKAYKALAIFCAGAVFAISLCVWCGLAAWTAWTQAGCTVKGAPLVDDRLLPAFVTWVSRTQGLPGLSGVFLAGVFGAGLSSLSCVLNACALVVIEDILRGWLNLQLKPFTEGIIARIITAILAVLSFIMLYVVSKLGGVLGVATALSAIAASTTCGIFTLGMVCWWVGPYGAISGGIAGALMAGITSVGIQISAVHGSRAPPMLFAEDCMKNASYLISETKNAEGGFPLFRLSYHWIAPLGLITTLTVGAIVGAIFDKKEFRKKDPDLFTPVIYRFLPSDYFSHKGEVRASLMTVTEDTTGSPLILDAIRPSIRKNRTRNGIGEKQKRRSL